MLCLPQGSCAPIVVLLLHTCMHLAASRVCRVRMHAPTRAAHELCVCVCVNMSGTHSLVIVMLQRQGDAVLQAMLLRPGRAGDAQQNRRALQPDEQRHLRGQPGPMRRLPAPLPAVLLLHVCGTSRGAARASTTTHGLLADAASTFWLPLPLTRMPACTDVDVRGGLVVSAAVAWLHGGGGRERQLSCASH